MCIEAQRLAATRNGDPSARYRVRIDYDNLVALCRNQRPLRTAMAAGSVPPELQNLWVRLKAAGVKVALYRRGEHLGEQNVPDVYLQNEMYRDTARKRPPGVAVLVTGDGAGFEEDEGFGSVLKDMHVAGWKVEVLSWRHCVSQAMLQWVQKNGTFIPLYDSITFLEPSRSARDWPGDARNAKPLDLTKRPM